MVGVPVTKPLVLSHYSNAAAAPAAHAAAAGAASASGVPDQPWGDEETLRGALNRVQSAAERGEPGAIVVALEGGVGPAFAVAHPLTSGAGGAGSGCAENVSPNCSRGPGGGAAAFMASPAEQQLECFAWAAIRAPSGAVSHARSASFTLPPAVAELVHRGWELGAADDEVFQRVKSGQGTGTIGRLTLVHGHPLLTRRQYYEHAVLCALIPLMNSELYPGFELPGAAPS